MNTSIVLAILIFLFFALLLLSRLRYEATVKQIWQSLRSKSKETVFTQETIVNLPGSVQKYLLHAIALGTPLSDYVELEMKGDFRLKPEAEWLPMEASEIIATSGGFVWQARVGQGWNSFSGADYWHHGKGRMRFSLWGLIPVVDAQNEQITRSGSGRLAGEYSIWLPSALLPENGVTWQAISENTLQANLQLNSEPINLTLTIDAEGKLQKISLLRWQEGIGDDGWQYIPFEVEVKAEQTFGGYTIPSVINAGWRFNEKNYFEFFRARIEQAKFA